VGRNPVQKPNSQSVRRGIAGAGAETSPIQVSTPPVRIIGTGRRHKGGFRLSDR
jgi:hypothetical protein